MPAPAQAYFYNNLRYNLRKLKKQRNLSLVFLGLGIKFWPLAVLGGFMLWNTRSNELPKIPAQLIKRTQRRFALSSARASTPARSTTTGSTRYGASKPQPLRLNQNPADLGTQHLQTGYMLDYDLKTWHITQHWQYDFKNSSELLFKLVSGIDNVLLQVASPESVPQLIVQRLVNIHTVSDQLEQHLLTGHLPPTILQYQEKNFYRESPKEGKVFDITSGSSGASVKQIEYWDEERKNRLLIEILESKHVRATYGSLVSSYSFSDILPSAS
jgi:hypothetical protein